jgi:hypothetical protein
MKAISDRQLAYIVARKQGMSPSIAAVQAGFSRTSCHALEKNPRVASALAAFPSTPPVPTSIGIPSAAIAQVSQTVSIVGKFPPIEPVTREELISIFSNVCRDADVPLPQRLLAGKILADVCGYNSEKNSAMATVVNLGASEKEL